MLFTRDALILIAGRSLRLFAYGFLSVLFALYLAALGLSEWQIGVIFTVALAGGAIATTMISLVAERWGRRRWLILSAIVMAAAGAALALSDDFAVLVVFAALGVLSPSGHEVGPFLALEQAALSQTLEDPGDGRICISIQGKFILVI